jgi:hypothetical protein
VIRAIEPARRLRLVILDACRDNPFNRKMQRTVAMRAVTNGLAKIELRLSDTIVAYAAKAGSTAEDGSGGNSPFTAALLKFLPEPGLDVQMAFRRVRDEVWARTGHRQEPYVYASLGGAELPLVPVALKVEPPSATSEAEVRRAYELTAQVGTKAAWEAFLKDFKTGLYANLARAQLAKLTPSAQQPPQDTDRQVSEADRAWDQLKNSDDRLAIRKFIELYPASVHVPNAQHRLDVLEQAAKALEEQAQRAKAAEQERQREEREAARQREEEIQRAKAAEQERQRQEREAAIEAARRAKAAEEEKQRQEREAAIEAAKRAKAAEEEKQRQEREAALRREEQERLAKAAEADRQRVEREIAKRREEEQRVAAAKEAERQRQEREAEAERQRRERAAEAARQRQEREAAQRREEEDRRVKEAALRLEQTCKRDEETLSRLKKNGLKAQADVAKLEKDLGCERLRPDVVTLREQLKEQAAKEAPAAKTGEEDEASSKNRRVGHNKPAPKHEASKPRREQENRTARHASPPPPRATSQAISVPRPATPRAGMMIGY